METRSAVPSILCCSWPAHHPKDTTKFNVLWLSGAPSHHFISVRPLESVELEIRSKATQITNSSVAKMFDKVCAQCLLLPRVSTADKGTKKQTTAPKALSSDSCHCTSPTKLSCHAKLHTFLQWP